MDEKLILNNGFGSPGETARVMTKEFLKLKENHEDDFVTISVEMLEERALNYESMGLNILDSDMIKKIYIESYDQFPFLILADIYLTNKAQGVRNIQALLQHLDNIIDVVLDNYNSMVSSRDKIHNRADLKKMIKEFIDTDSHLIDTPEISRESSLKYDSLYVSEEMDCTHFLKFYEDRIVINVTVEGIGLLTKMNYDMANKNICKTDCGGQGFYKIVEDKIEFSINSESGVVFYSGRVLMNQLDINVYSNINGHESRKIYDLAVFKLNI